MSVDASDIEVPRSRRRLSTVIQKAGDVIRTDDVIAILSVERPQATQLLARWTRQAWLRRVGRGAYVSASLDLLGSERVLDDPWVLIPAFYAPAYIGGWSAAEHWHLTDQIFRPTLVMTTRAVREKHERRHGARFELYHIHERKFFGTTPLWRHQTKIMISDVPRTIIDMLDQPDNGAGIQHTIDCLIEYLDHPERNDDKLIEYAKELGNGAVFKRLGFLAEKFPGTADMREACLQNLTAGHAKIWPTMECPKLITKWRLRVPEIGLIYTRSEY